MKIDVEYTEEDVKQLVLTDIRKKLDADISVQDVTFEVVTTQNWRAKEWEQGRFRARITK